MLEFLLELIGGLIAEFIGEYFIGFTFQILKILLKPLVYVGAFVMFLLCLGKIPYTTLINDEYGVRLAGFLGGVIAVVVLLFNVL